MNKLFKITGAIPFMMAVFLNAFVDLGHKIVIQNTIFKLYDGQEQVILTAIINGLILLPFIMLFSPAGFISDRFPKNQVMRYSAWAAVGLTVGITLCYAAGWFWAAFAMTFLLAMQSAIYSPAKYGYLKGFFGKQNLAEANGIVQAISIVAILAGTLLMSVLFEMWYPEGTTDKAEVLQSLVPIGFMLIAGSIAELFMMYRLPQVDQGNQERFDLKAYSQGKLLKANLQPVLSRDVIRLSIVGLAMFWSIGQVMLASFPAFAKEQIGETNTLVIQAIIAATGIGIALGSTIASRFSRNYIETGLIPLGAAGIGIGLWILPTLESPWMMGLDFLLIGTMGGLFIVPLNAMIQFYAGDNEMGRVLAANNLIQNVGMLSFLVLTAVFALLGISSKQLLMLTAVFAVVGGLYTVYKLPQSLVRFLLTYMMSRHYRINVQGMKHVPESGGVLLLGNHISWIDWAIVQIAYPRPVQFVMLKSIYERWYLKWFFDLFGCVPIESGANAEQSLNIVTELLNQGKVVCLFPEGTISRTGHLAEFRRGYERAAQAADADVVIQPFYIRGLWGSQFSRSSDKLKSLRSRAGGRDLIVSFGELLEKDTEVDVLKRRVLDLSIDSWSGYADSLPTLPQAWIETVKQFSSDMAVANSRNELFPQASLSGLDTLLNARHLSKQIRQQSSGKNVAVLLPPSVEAVEIIMGLLMSGKTVVPLNPTMNADAWNEAIAKARIKTIYTSQAFVDQLVDNKFEWDIRAKDLDIQRLEDADQVSPIARRIDSVLFRLLPQPVIQRWWCRKLSPARTAAILFNQTQSGELEGIKLSHKNIISNIKQLSDVLNTEERDVMINSDDIHSANGFISCLLLPLIEGIPLVCLPQTTDALATSKIIARYRVTLMCSPVQKLERFLDHEKLHPLMFESLRAIIGVHAHENQSQDLRERFQQKFSKTVLEAFCASPSSPIISINLPDALDFDSWRVQLGGKAGTLGMPLPGSSVKVVDKETQQETSTGTRGEIQFGGVQIMQRLNAEREQAQWFATSSSGYLDEDGFLCIR